jgi:C-methyltransferase
MTHPAELVADLAKGHIPARCLHVIADAGVADAVGPDGATPAAIAATTGLSADAVDRMLRLLAAHGIFEHGPGGTYRHNAASELLRSEHPRSLRSYVRMTGMPSFWDRYTELHAAARAGQRPHTMASLVEYFASHPEESAIFNAAMVSKSRTVLPAVAEAYDFSAIATIADIGGGRGHLLKLVLDRAPHARGVLFDLPHVVAEAEPAPRLTVKPGSFFVDELPRADAYLLMDLLHDWDDADAARILQAVRRAAPSGAKLLIVETLVAEAPGPHFGKTLDIIMLAVTGGRERTRTQHGALLSAAGFDLIRVLPTASQYSIVEAAAV